MAGVTDTDFEPEMLAEILHKNLSVKEFSDKRFTWFWLGSYEKGLQQIKVEISKREYPDKYDLKDFLGINPHTGFSDHVCPQAVCGVGSPQNGQPRFVQCLVATKAASTNKWRNH